MQYDTPEPVPARRGKRIADDTLQFERFFRVPIERVWHALTTPEGLAPWLGSATIDLRPGGTFAVALAEHIFIDGRIEAIRPPHELTISWLELEDGQPTQHATTSDDRSELSFALHGVGGGTMLLLTHRLLRPGESMHSFGAGWHVHMDELAAALAGSSPMERKAAYDRLHPSYVSVL